VAIEAEERGEFKSQIDAILMILAGELRWPVVSRFG
jgi:hypothetical protein